jgi:starvation-inducible outer membrane lipoprotein
VNLKNKMLRLYQERLFLFLAFILSACIIINNLINEPMTLIEKLFHF